MAGNAKMGLNPVPIKKIEHHKLDAPRAFYRRGVKDDTPYMIVEGDYSGFQLRIIAMESHDKNMIHAFKDLGGDLHSMTAMAIFHPFNDITLEDFIAHKKEKPYKGERKIAKTVNFGNAYGMTMFTMAQRLREEWSDEEAKEYVQKFGLKPVRLHGQDSDDYLTSASQIISQFFRAYPGFKLLSNQRHKEGEQNGVIRSVFGCTRFVPQLMYIGRDDKLRASKDISNLHNICVNSPVQTHEVTIISRAMRNFEKWAYENRRPEDRPVICGTIHDAVTYYVKFGDKEAFQKMHELYEYNYPENENVPLAYDIEYALPNDKEHPTYWGFGYDEGEGPMFQK